MNIKKILKKHNTKYLYLSIILLCSLTTSLLVPNPVNASEASASQYCKNDRKLTVGSGTYRNCMAAWLCGYKYYQTPSTKCRNSTKYKYDGHNINLKYWIDHYPNGIIASSLSKGKAAGSKNATSKPTSDSSTGGGDSSTNSSTDSNTDDTSIDGNVAAEDTPTQDGIADDLGSDIKDGRVTLTNNDAEKAGIEKKYADDIVVGVLNIVYSVSAAIAVIVIVGAGIMYTTSDGDPSRASKAKSAIIYSAVGLVIIGSAFIITGVIQGIAYN